MAPQPQPAVAVDALVEEILGAAQGLRIFPAKLEPVGGRKGHDGGHRRDQHADDGRNDNTRRHLVCFVLSGLVILKPESGPWTQTPRQTLGTKNRNTRRSQLLPPRYRSILYTPQWGKNNTSTATPAV